MAMRVFEEFLKNPSTVPKIYWRIEKLGKTKKRKITGKAEYKIRFWPVEKGKNGEQILETFVEATYILPELTRKQKREFEKILEKTDTTYVREGVEEKFLKDLELNKKIRFPLSHLKRKEAIEIIREVNDLFGFPQYKD
ncbi:MAG: hypothetical protein GTN40_04705 [Candidatus Aenigmarchaeota archaeon]|nr:hypothetical protein [Candidatus Aenigmarchaeota archaeon]